MIAAYLCVCKTLQSKIQELPASKYNLTSDNGFYLKLKFQKHKCSSKGIASLFQK